MVGEIARRLQIGEMTVYRLCGAARKARAAEHLAAVTSAIHQIHASGIISYTGVAAQLTARNIRTLSGATQWNHSTVRKIMLRLGLVSSHQ